MKIRPLGPEDVGPLSDLVDADRLPGQPACTPAMVATVLAGRCTLDAWWWQELVTMRVVAAEGPEGELAGAGSVGRRASGFRYLLWLHAREDRRVLDALLRALLRGVRLTDPVFAFSATTELSVGLEGLPRHARPRTHEALLARGFVGVDRWLYLRASGPGPAPEVEYRQRGYGDLRVEIALADEVVAAAELGLPVPGLGVLWWLEVNPEHRRRGLGRQALRAARRVLAEAGASETILFVDHDDPAARDRRPALELYRSEGYEVVDHLWSYQRGDVPVEGRP